MSGSYLQKHQQVGLWLTDPLTNSFSDLSSPPNTPSTSLPQGLVLSALLYHPTMTTTAPLTQTVIW